MANRFLDKESGATASTAIADDTTGRAKVKNLPDAAGIVYDKVDGFIKYNDAGNIRTLVNTDEVQTLTNKTISDPTGFRNEQCAVFDVGGAALHAAVLPAFTAPADCIITRVFLNVTTVATAACTVDVGVTAVSSTTTSDTLLDGVDVNAAIALFDSGDSSLDTAANDQAQTLASGKWVTIDEKTGDSTGLVAKLYVFYILA